MKIDSVLQECLQNKDLDNFIITDNLRVKRLYTEPLIFYIYELDLYITESNKEIITLGVKDVVKYVKNYNL